MNCKDNQNSTLYKQGLVEISLGTFDVLLNQEILLFEKKNQVLIHNEILQSITR